MAKKHEPKPLGQWTALEELLLAYAVKRHGVGSWDAIAKELQSRVAMQTNYVSSVITPHNCRDEFLRLRRRFTPLDSATAEMAEEESCLVAMLDELRRIRIEELRREVKRHDVSIVSLESKIKRLEEERGRSIAEETDLRGQATEPEGTKASPAILAGESSATAGEAAEADKSDDRSFNESNSIGQKPELTTATRETQDDAVKDRISSAKREPAEHTGPNPVQPRTEPDRNIDPSSRFRAADHDAVERCGREAEAAEMKATRTGRLDESNEYRHSMTESKGEAATPKQSSDVQSSASLSKKKRRRNGRAVARGGGTASSREEDPEAEEVSPTTQKRVAAVKPPEPLVDLLKKIRSHRLGSAFERRLRIQESERYKNLIRQRMDLRIIQTRLESGAYSDFTTKFYSDLLLLFNNAIVFHRKTSSEYSAAVELRSLVTKALKEYRLRYLIPPASVASSKSKVPNKPPPVSVSVYSLKSKRSIGACGKRSSLKPKTGKKIIEEKEKKQDAAVKENKDDAFRRHNGGSVNVASSGKCRKERSTGNNKDDNSNHNNNNGEMKKQEYGNNELSSHDMPTSKSVAKSTTMINPKKNEKKRQGVVSFLRRMKQSVSSDSDGDGDGDRKADVLGSEGEKKEKGKEKKGDKKLRGATRSVSLAANGKGKKSTGSVVRKTMGNAAAIATANAAGKAKGKRGRENNGEGSGGEGRREKKRVKG